MTHEEYGTLPENSPYQWLAVGDCSRCIAEKGCMRRCEAHETANRMRWYKLLNRICERPKTEGETTNDGQRAV